MERLREKGLIDMYNNVAFAGEWGEGEYKGTEWQWKKYN